MKQNFTTKLLTVLLLFPLALFAQEEAESNFGLKWSGFVKTDYMFDTRQIVAAREGHFLIVPAAESLDANNKDINATPNFNILSIQSRLTGTITGPDFQGFKTSGVLEADFFGNGGDENGFRLRHAFLKLSNEKVDILMGQYWHPMFVTSVFPGTYSFNTGMPFQPFARNPQIRLSSKGSFRVNAILFTERDFKTAGASVSQAGMPQAHLQFEYGDKKSFLAGAGANYKTVLPALGGEKLSSIAAQAFVTATFNGITWKAEGVYGENMSDLLSIGGFGVNNNGDFISSSTISAWTEFSGKAGENIAWGLFGGYSMNQGFGEAVAYTSGFLADGVANILRVSPRVGFTAGKTTLGVEVEFTQAQYGGLDATTGNMVTTGIDPVSNVRALFTAMYKF